MDSPAVKNPARLQILSRRVSTHICISPPGVLCRETAGRSSWTGHGSSRCGLCNDRTHHHTHVYGKVCVGLSVSHSDLAHVRVINVEEPVETHVNTERHVDEVFVLLLQAVVDGRQAVDDVGDRQQLAVVAEFVLLERVLSHAEVQQVHWGKRRTMRGTESTSEPTGRLCWNLKRVAGWRK